MRKFTLLFFIFLSCKSFAQTYGNEWISFDAAQQYSTQQYWKIKVWKDGIYRISPSDLFAAQFPQTVDPHRIQVFNQGVEQFINVKGEADSILDPSDYIEFYGTKNDGTFDTRLYQNPGDQGNTKYSLFTDTAVYFITINNNSVSNRRMLYEVKTDYSNYTPETYYTQNVFFTTKASYLTGYKDIYGSSLSSYTAGEGFADAGIQSNGNNNVTISVPTPNAVASPIPAVQIRMCGYNMRDHYLGIDVDGSNYVNDVFQYYEVRDYSFTLNNSPVGTSFDFKFTAKPDTFNFTNSIIYLKHIDLNYSHTFSFAGETASHYFMDAKGSFTSAYTRWDISNLNFSNPVLLVYSGDTLKKIALSGTGNTFQALIPTYGFDKNCLLIDSVANTFTNNVAVNYSISPVIASDPGAPVARFTNFAFNPNADYLIITHRRLWNAATAYKNYRQNNLYNPYPNTLMAESNELYDQFAYGIAKHPLSIKNFVKYGLDNFGVKPKYMFLIGKSIKNYLKIIQPWTDSANLVPTFGDPPSDLMLVNNLIPGDSVVRPSIAVGRLSAVTETDVYDYLEKIQAYESNPQAEWMKNVLHFAGGIDIDQRNYIQSLLDQYTAIVSDSAFGGYVRTLSKTITDPIQISLSQQLQQIIDSGVSVMTFYAHAGASSFDISTDDPSVWNNIDRYPMIIGNSCYVGDAHQDTRTAVENFVLQHKKGAIGFIGSAAVNFIENLFPYTLSLYKEFSRYDYGQPIGKCMLRAIDTTWVIYPAGFYAEAVTIGMNLQGDPAIILNAAEKPDLRIQSSDILFEPASVSAALDSLTLSVTVKNIGMAINGPYYVEVRRNFPNGNFTDTIIQRHKIGYVDSLKLKFPVDPAQGPGYNTFIVSVDPANSIDEITDTNNTAQQQLFILSNDITPIYPTPYAIVPDNNFQLKASTVNQFAPPTRYVFEMDTIDTYNSPLYWHDTITAAGGLIVKNLPYPIVQNTVYYWRVSRDSMPGDPVHPQWNEASFIYMPTKTGWSQAHFFQFKNDDYKNIIFNRPSRKWDYVTTKSVLKSETNNKPVNYDNSLEVQYFINGNLQDYSGCGLSPAIFVAILDPLTLQPKLTGQPDTHYGNFNDNGCRTSRQDKFFEFQTGDQVQVDSLKNLLSGKLPAGQYVLIYTWGINQFSTLDNSLKQIFVNLGSDSINALQDGQAWILFSQIGNPLIAHEVTSSQPNQKITLIDSLGGNWNHGFITSEKIGPANKWESLHWNIDNVESLDTINLQLWGIDTLQHETLLIDTIKPAVTDIFNLYQNIDAAFYKYLYFKLDLKDDSVLPDPSQMNKWQIYYQEVPEAMVNPQLYYHISNTKPQQGDSVTVEMAIQNISNSDMDSILVDYYIYNAQNQKIDFPSARYRKLPAGDSLHCSLSFSTASLPGNNVLWIEANPRNDQPEQFHFNNYAQISLKVERDITNPILDVTFDGIHILNGDIVSAKPSVEVSLKDENQFLLLNDTADFIVFIYPQGQSFSKKRLHFESAPNVSTNKELMQWTAATPGKNTFKINYRPELQTGIYTLEITAQDRSSNQSGANVYQTEFEVDTNSTITEVINYPNPFSTSTRFVFTLTGSDLPKYFKIQIMTISGKIIREITKEELGPLHIGRNITQYAWDGRDQFGDQLANGVYLYRVMTQLNGTSIQKRETDADKYFKHGWGKMYLMR